MRGRKQENNEGKKMEQTLQGKQVTEVLASKNEGGGYLNISGDNIITPIVSSQTLVSLKVCSS